MTTSRKAVAMAAVMAGGALMASSGQAPARRAANLIVTHANVFTVDRATPKAEAVAVSGDRIVAVGTAADIESWRGPQTRVIDAGGRFVMPGFNDTHLHFTSGGMQLDNVDLKDAASPEEFARRIGERAKTTPKGEWITGGDWDEQAWASPALPTRELIDALTRDTPVFVNRYDGHMSLANSIALRLAGVTAKTPDPPGGTIVKDARGEPTGILKDAAMAYVDKVIPAPTPERRERAVRRALAHAASLGVTSVQDMNPSYDDIAIYEALAKKGELTCRIYVAPLETQWIERARKGTGVTIDMPFLRTGAVKGYADGSLGSTTAYFFQPYLDAPGTRGLLSDEMQPLDGMRQRLIEADKAGQQLCIHAIGDQAISMTLDLFADVIKADGPRDRRMRIEHAQHVAPKDFARFKALGVIASVQPYHAIDDGRWAEKRIGPERAKTTYAFRTFLDEGVRLSLGTDWPVAPLDPVLGLYAAVTRATLDGKHPGGWVPEQKITIGEAIEGYTLTPAFAEFQEKEKGSLSTGKLADIVILSADPFAVAPAELRNLKVETTIAGGRVVYERGSVGSKQ